jgi:hypothetical protein
MTSNSVMFDQMNMGKLEKLYKKLETLLLRSLEEL